MRNILLIVATLGVALLAIAVIPAHSEPVIVQDEEFCDKFNKCATPEKEKIKCSKCDRNQIAKNFSMCTSCANKEKVCAMCGKYKKGTTPPKKAGGGKCKTIDEAVALVKAEDMRELLSWIAHDDKQGRLAGSPEHQKCLDRYAEIYKAAGLKPGAAGQWFQPVTVGGRASNNVVALLEGENKNEIIIYGGHSDHVGVKGNGPPGQQKPGGGGDAIYNGADDNGSGSCTVVTIAKILGESGLKPKRTIAFINWTGEEWGLVGSKHNARNLLWPKENILAVVNTDMLGRLSSKGSVDVGGLGTEDGQDWEGIVTNACNKVGIKPNLKQESRISGGDSDHSSYRDIGIPGMYWFTGVHADYHMPSDHADRIDYDGMSKIAKAVILTLWEMANSSKRWGFKQN
jgi:hypothetical protein